MQRTLSSEAFGGVTTMAVFHLLLKMAFKIIAVGKIVALSWNLFDDVALRTPLDLVGINCLVVGFEYFTGC